ncbi:MAG: hypothetical protein KJ674_05900 [Nanoarchaeota archaeon]|nr:hypothetical protein [Nanoarchaeota archaeon]
MAPPIGHALKPKAVTFTPVLPITRFSKLCISIPPNPDKPEKYPKQFAAKSQRHEDIIFFLCALVSWWQDEKSFATKKYKIQ